MYESSHAVFHDAVKQQSVIWCAYAIPRVYTPCLPFRRQWLYNKIVALPQDFLYTFTARYWSVLFSGACVGWKYMFLHNSSSHGVLQQLSTWFCQFVPTSHVFCKVCIKRQITWPGILCVILVGLSKSSDYSILAILWWSFFGLQELTTKEKCDLENGI